jgi:hypothetical protein
VLVLTVETVAEVQDLFAPARRLYRPPLVEGAVCLVLEPGDGRPLRWTAATPRTMRAPQTVARVLDAVLGDIRPGNVVAAGVATPQIARAETAVLAARGVDAARALEGRAGEALACGPLLAVARVRASGVPGPCLVTAAWRGEYAALLWPF